MNGAEIRVRPRFSRGMEHDEQDEGWRGGPVRSPATRTRL